MSVRVRFLGVFVTDQQRALDFYTNKLGFKKTTDEAMGEYRWIEVTPPGGDTSIALAPSQGEHNPVGVFVNGGLTTDNMDATYKEWSERGVEFVQKPEVQPWGMKMAIFADPDDNQFVLTERTD